MYSYTKFTSDSGVLTKRYTSETDKPKVHPLSSGTYEVKTVTTHEEFVEAIRGLQTNQAHSYSLPIDKAGNEGRIVTQSDSSINIDDRIIPKTKDYFNCDKKQPGILFIDIDNNDPREEAIRKLSELYEPFGNTTYVYATSASHGIGGKEGYHLYYFVPDISKINKAMKNLFDLSFEEHGFFDPDKRGTLRSYSFFDLSVYQRAKLDFIAGPDCVTFTAPARIIRVVRKANRILDIAPLKQLSVDASDTIKKAKAAIRPKQKEVIKREAAKKGVSSEEYEKGLECREIRPPDTLYNADGGAIDLGDLLVKLSTAYLKNEELDEEGIEIEHPSDGGLSNKTMLFYNHSSGCPNINTFAHGQQTWKLRHSEESFSRLDGIGNEHRRKYLRRAHGLVASEVDNRLPPHEKTDEVFEMMKETFEQEYKTPRILEQQWKDQITLYLHMLLEGHKGRYSIELGMGSAKSKVILHVILYLYREGHQIPIAVSFEKIKEIEENYNWLIGRMHCVQTHGLGQERVLPCPEDYLKRKHSQEQTSVDELQQALIVFHTHHVVRKDDFIGTFFSYQGRKRDLFIYDEALPTGLEISIQAETARDHLSYIFNRYRVNSLQGIPYIWLKEMYELIGKALILMKEDSSVKVFDINILHLSRHFINTGYYVDKEEVASFVTTLMQIGSSENPSFQVVYDKNGIAFMASKSNQTTDIDCLINTDSSRSTRKVHEFTTNPIVKYTIPEWRGDEPGTITIVPYMHTGKGVVKKKYGWHLWFINEWQNIVQSKKLLVCRNKKFDHISQGVKHRGPWGLPGEVKERDRGLAHNNVVFTSWGQHKQTNDFMDCDGIVALHYFRKPHYAYKNSVYAEQGYVSEISPNVMREVTYGGIAEGLQQLFGRGTKRKGKKCDCLLFAGSFEETYEIMRILIGLFPDDDIKVFPIPGWLYRENALTQFTHKGGSPQRWKSAKERQRANAFVRAAEGKGCQFSSLTIREYLNDWDNDNSVTPVKWMKVNGYIV